MESLRDVAIITRFAHILIGGGGEDFFFTGQGGGEAFFCMGQGGGEAFFFTTECGVYTRKPHN